MESATRRGRRVLFTALGAGDRVLVPRAPPIRHYLACCSCAAQGIAVSILWPSDEHGQIDLAALPGLVRDRNDS